jgi:hypothetical protein
MRIGENMPVINALVPQVEVPQQAAPVRSIVPADAERPNYYVGPGVIVDISPEGWAAYKQGEQDNGSAVGKAGEAAEVQECQTCKNRRYVDGSDDPSVSFQSPTHISPGQSASMVMSHEREHVTNEQARADREGREVISQTVSLQVSTCPECGRMYVSGGVTRTITAEKNEEEGLEYRG